MILCRNQTNHEKRWPMKHSLKTNGVLVKLVITLLIAITIGLIPTNGAFSAEMKAFLAITIVCIFMIATQLFSTPLIPALMLMFGYSLICGMDAAMSGWANEAPWCIIGVLIIVQAVDKTPLFRRVTYSVMRFLGGSYASICTGMYFVGLLLSLLGNNIIPLVLVLAFGIVKSLDYTEKGASAGIMLCAYLGAAEASGFVYNPTINPMLYGIASSIDPSIPAGSNYVEWFINGAIFIPYYVILLVVVILLFRPKQTYEKNAKDYFRLELNKLGHVSRDEILSAVVLITILLFLLTNPWHKISMVYGFIGAAIILYIPRFGIGTGEDIRKVDFGFPIFIVACLSIGEVATRLGVSDLLIDIFVPYINGKNLFVYFSTICIVVFLLNFVMTPMAVYSALLAPLTAITMQIPGVHDIFPLLMTLIVGVTNILFPHEISNTLMLYSFNTIEMKDFIKIFGLKAIIAFIFLNLAVAYWKLIGLLA